jgi:type IV secretion system protein VirD4
MKFSRFEKAALAAVFLLFMAASYYLTAAYAYTGNIFLVPEKLQVLVRNFGWYWTDLTPRGLFAGCGFYAMFFLYVCSKKGNFMRGEEYGRARWASAKELTRKMGNPDDEKNRILTENLRISIDTRRTQINNNVCCIGGSGSRKTYGFVVPNLQKANASFIFTDPDGGLLREFGRYLEEQGIPDRVAQPGEPEKSDCYNPFVYIKKEEDIVRLISNLIANTTPPNSMKGEPFWEKAEALYLEALFLYVWRSKNPAESRISIRS